MRLSYAGYKLALATLAWLLIVFMVGLLSGPAGAVTRISTIAPECHHTENENRSQTVLRDFDHRTGYPHGRKGYVRDHICPLACGGADTVSNLQWQTLAEGKAKDKIERTSLGYKLYCLGVK